MSERNLFIWEKDRDNNLLPLGEDGLAIFSQRELKALLPGDWNGFQTIFILAELQWEGAPPLTLAGIQVLEKLRVELQVRAPVVICSFFPKEMILREKEKVGNLLKTPGHYFIALPSVLKNWQSPLPYERLSANLLADINYHIFDLKGNVDEIFHQLKGTIGYEPEAALQRAYDALLTLFPVSVRHELISVFARMRRTIASHPDRSPSEVAAGFKEDLLALLQLQPVQDSVRAPQRDWGVLCIDDDERTLGELKDRLSPWNIRCLTARSGPQAFELLKKDAIGDLNIEGASNPQQPNSIAVIVCDLRFLNPDDTWQDWQGWDIIDHIFYNFPDNHVSFFILTSKKGAILRKIRETRSASVFMYAKNDVLGKNNERGFRAFVERVSEEGERVSEIICSFPAGGYWSEAYRKKFKYPLRDYYRYHRLLEGYTRREKDISDRALAYIREAEWVKDDRHHSAFQKVETVYQFMSGLSEPPWDVAGLEKFMAKLIGRRIVIGLYLKGWEESEISNILKDREMSFKSVDRQLFNVHLSFSTKLEKDIPHHLLREEWIWAERVLNVSPLVLDRGFYHALITLMDQWQDDLRAAGCSDDFLDQELMIGNVEKAKGMLWKAVQLAYKHHLRDKFADDFFELTNDPHFYNTLRRTGLLAWVKHLLGQ